MIEKEETSRDSRNAEKLAVMKALLLRGRSAFMHFDPAVLGTQTIVPARLRLQPQVVFQIGLDMPVPIPDLNIDDWGFRGTLSFAGKPFTCAVPWQAVFALVGEDQKGRVWAEDMPAPIAAEVKAETVRRTFKKIEGEGGDLETRKTSQYLKPVKRERPAWMTVIEGEKKD
jgi:hypothetical protein